MRSFAVLCLFGRLASAQTFSLPVAEVPLSMGIPLADAGEAAALPLPEAPLERLGAASERPLPRLVRAARSTALASMLAAAAALGVGCGPDAPPAEAADAGDAGVYPNAYITYPNGHPLAVVGVNAEAT